MYGLQEIPHLRAYKPAVSYPKDRVESGRFSMVYLNSLTREDSVKTIEKGSIINKGISRYYIERRYHGKLFGRTYHENLLSLKVEPMTTPQGQTVRPERVLNNLRNANVFVDLSMYNRIFYTMTSTGATYIKKVIAYIDLLKEAISALEFKPYRYHTMIIDIEQWLSHETDSNFSVSTTDNPMMYIQFALKKNLEKFQELGDINLIFAANGMHLRINPSLCDKDSHNRFRTELRRLTNGLTTLAEEDIEDAVERENVKSEVSAYFTDDGFRRLTGQEQPSTEEEQMKRVIKKAVSDTVDKIQEKEPDIKDPSTLAKLAGDEIVDDQMASEIVKAVSTAAIGQNKASSKRDELLRERQREIKIHGKTLEELTSDIANTVERNKIQTNDISDKVSTTNDNVKHVKFNHFEKSYNDQLKEKDTANILKALNDTALPVFIRNIAIEDTSDELSLKETYKVDLEDANRVRHSLKFDMPKFIDDKFMYLNGNKKMIVKQLILKPIVKTGPNTVQIVSNYNKIFIRRYGKNVSSKITKMSKALLKDVKGVSVKTGNQLIANKEHITTIEYDELAKKYEHIAIGSKIKFYFNVDKILEDIAKYNLPKMTDTNVNRYLPLAILNEGGKRKVIYVDTDSQFVSSDNDMNGEDIITTILHYAGQDLSEVYKEQSAGKKYVYTRATLMAREVPILLLLGYVEGLTTVLKKANIKHYFSDTRPRVGEDQGVVQFEDGYLVYDRYPFENSLLLNTFSDIPTRAYTYADFDNKETYVDLFDIVLNQRNLAGGFDNFYDFMIDPITKEILEDLDLPTDFVDVVLYGHKLLVDNDFTPETDMSLYRVRSNELLNVYLYKAIASAYRQYYNTSQNNNPKKISIPQDAITKEVLTAQTIEDYSTLNPIVELEKSRSITPKGPNGANLAQAYTIEKRSYSQSMVGLMAMSTSPDGNVGVVRELTMEPSVTSARGYIDIKQDDLDSLKDTNLFSPAELLSPLGASRDDTIRTAMSIKQSKHIIPVKKSSPVLISNGLEQTIPYNLSTDFSVVARNDGKVIEIDEKNELIILEYKTGTPEEKFQAIDISSRTVKNGGGGFYLVNKLHHELKVGQTFKKNDILAYDSAFFSNDTDGVRFNIGSLQKVAVMSTYSTYEDSTLITQKLAKDVSAKITIPREITLGKNANIDYIVKVGDEVTVGDELLRFESSFEDDSINKFLANVGDDLQEDIRTLGKHPVLSKYSGKVVDIKVFCTVDLEELSPSLRKLVSGYYNKNKKRKSVLDKYDKTPSSYKMNMHLTDPTDKTITKDGKIKGNIVGDGVLIQIFVEYEDVAGVGDKITFFTALKSIVGEVIEPGYEPYAISRPNEEISAFIAPGAVLARMTPSILLSMFGNKVLVELKRSLKDIYNS